MGEGESDGERRKKGKERWGKETREMGGGGRGRVRGGGVEGDVREAGYISDGPQVYVVMEKKHRFLLSPLGRENSLES